MGKVFDYITRKLATEKLHFALIDPDDVDIDTVDKVAAAIERAGCDAIMVGGSSSAVGQINDLTIQGIKKGSTLPVIIFPGNWSAVSPYADAIFFMSILNSRNPYFITKAQALGAHSVKMFRLEPLAMGYLVVEPGETVGWIAEADLIPRRKPKIAAAYALAAQFMGMDLIYLEAGSGASEPVPDSMISMVRTVVDIPIVVGGGICTPEQASRVVKAGADIVVTGTIIEKAENIEGALSPIVRAVKGES
ncbi:MAG: geranylgeranylglyceryl/heptaprenylglyceryl phosphate synthase [Candidatus Methanofastidiosia archaeon]